MFFKNGKKFLILILAAGLLLSGCGSMKGLAKDADFNSNYANTDEDTEDIYVSGVSGIIRLIDTENMLIDFYELGSTEIKSLYYDGTTTIADRFGQPLSMVQLLQGDMVSIAYNSPLSKAGRITMMEDAFSYSDITKYSVENNGTQMSIGEDIFSVDPNVHIFSDGTEIGIDRLISKDGLTVQGIGHNICSIRVDDGHGYLELSGEDALIGGWIEIGQTVISQISENMLFTVPEGTYTVRLTNTGIEEYREVTITRNEIFTLDLSGIKSPEPEKGVISFDINPSTAVTEIDGKVIDTAFRIKLPIGVHEIRVSATGYSSVMQYFEVTGENQTISIDLEKITAEEAVESAQTQTESSTGSVSGNSLSKDQYYNSIIIDSPRDADVYEDNVYKGRIPVSYKKTTGTHTLTLRRPGYRTVSYTVTVYDDGKDQKYAFPDMIPDGSVSGNSLSTPTPTPTPTGSVSGNSLSSATPTPTITP